jgi:hypothetical protein
VRGVKIINAMRDVGNENMLLHGERPRIELNTKYSPIWYKCSSKTAKGEDQKHLHLKKKRKVRSKKKTHDVNDEPTRPLIQIYISCSSRATPSVVVTPLAIGP